VAGFYSARGGIIPPLPWPVLHRRFQLLLSGREVALLFFAVVFRNFSGARGSRSFSAQREKRLPFQSLRHYVTKSLSSFFN
jgi:hypothetical protein